MFITIAVEQAVVWVLVMQWARVWSSVGTSFLREVSSGTFLTYKTKSGRLGLQGPRISFGRHNHPSIFTLLEWMGAWMVCIVFHVRVVSEVAPALSWYLIRAGSPCPCVVKNVCMWSRFNFLCRQVVILQGPAGVSHVKALIKGRLN